MYGGGFEGGGFEGESEGGVEFVKVRVTVGMG